MLIFPIKKNLPLAENGFWVAQVKMGLMSALVQHCAFAVDIWSHLADICLFFGGRYLVKPHWPPWQRVPPLV